ncbi:hypothetical protein BpHYR1_020599 [Brachionus plicatilis]|uniref:Uncharacterized protein n=1 Tax=Brachionus plicatilis TaxID=10195 RepID=A0A3M7PQB8_BRAPC|nr:hypothetical protein BpHYR1_020599 [Brachionus plicatilis]
MNKILACRYSIKLNSKRILAPCHLGYSRRDFFAKENNPDTLYLQETSEIKKIKNFKKLSNILQIFFENLTQMKWTNFSRDMKIIDGIDLVLKFNEFNPLLISLIDKINSRHDFLAIKDYFLKNLDQLSPKEQAILFRLMNLLDKNFKENPLVLKLERLYYENLNHFDLNDLLNYHRGFFILRKPFSPSKYESFSRSADIVSKKVFQIIDSNGKSQSSSNSLEQLFPSINLSFSDLPLVLFSIRLYSPMLTMDTQVKYFEILIEKFRDLPDLKENMFTLADYFVVLDKIYIQNLNKNNQIFNSYNSYKKLFEENFGLLASNLKNLSGDFERFELFIKFFAVFSRSNGLRIKDSENILEFFKQKLANSTDSQNIYKYIFSIKEFRKTFDTSRYDFRKQFDLDKLVGHKSKQIMENMDFFSVKRLLGAIDSKYFNFQPSNYDLILESFKIKNESSMINDSLVFCMTNFFPIFFEPEIAKRFETSNLYPLYACSNLKYFSSNLPLILESFEKNARFYLFEDQVYVNEFVRNLEMINSRLLMENSEILIKILTKSFDELIMNLSLNNSQTKFPKVKLPSDPTQKIDLTGLNYDYKPIRNCLSTLAFIEKLVHLFNKKYIDYGFIDLSSHSMLSFQLFVKSFGDIFRFLKVNNISDENLEELLRFNLFKLCRHLYFISRLIKISQCYSPPLSKQLIESFLSLCEILCDPSFDREKLKHRLFSSYEHLFKFVELYSLYDIDCPEANISQKQKDQVQQYLSILYPKLRNDSNFGEIIKKNYHLLNLNILNEEAVKDFQNVVKNKSDSLNDRYVRLSKIIYQSIKMKFPDYQLNLKIDLDDHYREFSTRTFHEKFLKLYGEYVNKNPIIDNNLRTNYSFILDKNGKFLKNSEKKPHDALQIPVKIVDNEQMFKNCPKIKRNVLNYIEYMQKKYPLLILYQNELLNKTDEDIGKIVELKIMKSIKDFF